MFVNIRVIPILVQIEMAGGMSDMNYIARFCRFFEKYGPVPGLPLTSPTLFFGISRESKIARTQHGRSLDRQPEDSIPCCPVHPKGEKRKSRNRLTLDKKRYSHPYHRSTKIPVITAPKTKKPGWGWV